MSIEFKVPDLGENVDTGEVVAVLVKEGQTLAKDDPVLELETGKATIEVPADHGGKITKVHVNSGDTVKPGQVILTLEDSGDADEEKTEPESKPPQEEQKAEAAPAKDDKPEPESETDKPSSDESASETEKKAEKQADPADSEAKPAAAPPPSDGARLPVAAAPSVRKFAREVGVNIAQVSGTGPKGRITADDVKAHAKSLLTQPGAPALTGGAIRVPPLPDFTKWGDVERQAMNNVRKMTAQHMALCWGTIPHVTQHDKADITDLERMRKRYARKAEMAGGKLTLTAMLLKILASGLKVYPQFNASVDLANEEVVLKKYINIGVAVDTPKGLVVPVVRDVDKKNIIELSIELTEIADKSRDGKVGPADMKGGTFTLSNLGGIGGSFFTPIVNHPEVAILGIGRGAHEAVHTEQGFEPRLMLPMSLSYDHRVIDGADGARFLRWIADAIQEPLLVAMEG